MLVGSRQKLSSRDASVNGKISWSAYWPKLKLGMPHKSICKKIASALGAIKRIRHLIPFNVLINVYDSLIQPHFDYCSVVWSKCGIGLSDKLQRPQNRAARILKSANSDCNVDDLLPALVWRKLKHQRQVSTAIMMYKTVHGMTPDYLTSKFVSRDE